VPFSDQDAAPISRCLQRRVPDGRASIADTCRGLLRQMALTISRPSVVFAINIAQDCACVHNHRCHQKACVQYFCFMQAMRANIRASQHMWRYDYTSEYVVRRVNATRGDPELSAYRPNGTECPAATAGRGGGGTAAFSGADGAAIRSVNMKWHLTRRQVSVHPHMDLHSFGAALAAGCSAC